MEDTNHRIESLFNRTTEYVKTSFDLYKHKSIDKTSEILSTLIPGFILLVLATSFILFSSFALAFLFGKMLDGIGFGFFLVAAFYGIVGIIMHFMMRKWIKKRIRNYFNKQLLK